VSTGSWCRSLIISEDSNHCLRVFSSAMSAGASSDLSEDIAGLAVPFFFFFFFCKTSVRCKAGGVSCICNGLRLPTGRQPAEVDACSLHALEGDQHALVLSRSGWQTRCELGIGVRIPSRPPMAHVVLQELLRTIVPLRSWRFHHAFAVRFTSKSRNVYSGHVP